MSCHVGAIDVELVWNESPIVGHGQPDDLVYLDDIADGEYVALGLVLVP